MKKVEKCVNEMMEWMNNVMNAQARKSLDQEPVVRAQEIKAKIKVSVTDCSMLCFLRDSSCNHLNDHFSYKFFTSSWLRPDFLVYYWYHKIQKTCILAVHQMVFRAGGRNSVRGVRKFWIMERTQVGLWSEEALGGVALSRRYWDTVEVPETWAVTSPSSVLASSSDLEVKLLNLWTIFLFHRWGS